MIVQHSTDLICPNCGFTEAVFAQSFKLGCSCCYEVFAPQIGTMLEQLHGNAQHIGKMPDRWEGLTHELRKIEALLIDAVGDSARINFLLEKWDTISDSLKENQAIERIIP